MKKVTLKPFRRSFEASRTCELAKGKKYYEKVCAINEDETDKKEENGK
jgi:hypothetical protein